MPSCGSRELGGIGDTAANLKAAAAGEERREVDRCIRRWRNRPRGRHEKLAFLFAAASADREGA